MIRSTVGSMITCSLLSKTATAQQGGERIWYFQMLGGATTPTVVDGTVFAGGNSKDLHAIDAESGTEKWVFETTRGFRTPPMVVDNTVFAGCEDANLYAVDAEEGKQQWAFETEDKIQSSPTVVDNTVFIGSTDNNLYAVDAENGTEQWTFETDGLGESPTVVDDTVFVPSGSLYAVEAQNGSQRWAFEKEGFSSSSPTVAEGTVFVGDNNNKIFAVDAETGNEKWEFETGDSVHSSPTVASGTVFVGSDDNNLYALDAESGEQQWTFETKDLVWSSPTIVDDTVFVASRDETLYAVDAETGSQQWTFDLGGSSNTAPIVVDGTVFVGGPLLYAIDAGVNGSSDGSRAMLGTLGHHNDWRHAGQSIDISHLRSGNYVDGLSSIWPQIIGGTTLLTGTLAAGWGIHKWRQNSTSNETLISDHIPDTVPTSPRYDLNHENITTQKRLGVGGNADVYGAMCKTTDGQLSFALKEPRLSGTISPVRVERLLSEAETWASLDDHDHIVSIIDYGSDPLPWIAMEYMDGGNLGDRAKEFGFHQSLWTALAITRGVRHAHRRGVAHLDLKPQNILFRSVEDGWDVPKVADWGLSKHLLEHSHSRDGLSPQYAAPEQFDEKFGPTDERTDIYQLGAVFYTLFTGHPPFKGSTASVMREILSMDPTPPTHVNEKLPSGVDDIVQKAMAKQRDNRYESIIYLRDELTSIADKNGIR